MSPGDLEEAIAHVRALAHPSQRAMRERGVRELVAFLEERGTPLAAVTAVTAADVDAFKQTVRAREGATAVGREVKDKIEGGCAYLRLMSCRGEVREDEALFFALNPKLRKTVITAAFGDSLRARVLREAAGFEAELVARRVGEHRRAAYLRAAVKLVFFMDRIGKTVDAVTTEDWVRFEGEIRTEGSLKTPYMLAGSRAYLRWKGLAAQVGQPEGQWVAPYLAALAQLSPESKVALEDFRRRLSGMKRSARADYSAGARELLLFLERRKTPVPQMTVDDWRVFEEEIHTRAEEGQVGKSWVPAALVGARRFLCEHGREISQDLLLAVAHKVDTRFRVAVEREECDAELVREVEAFSKARGALGYVETSNTRQGAWRLLRFLADRGRRVQDMTREDWDDFRREAAAGTKFSDPAPLIAGASVYLRTKAREGVIVKSPAPPRPVRRASPPVLPEGLAAALVALDQGLAAHDFADNTRVSYRRAVWDLLAWMVETHGVRHVSEITRERITPYRLRLQTEPGVRGALLSLHTQIGILAALRFFFSWLVKTGWMLADPTRHLLYPRSPQYLPRSLKVLDVSRLLRSLPKTPVGLRDRAIVELLWGTGMRRGELARLKLTDVDLDSRQILIREGKGRKDRMVPLGAKAKQTLLEYLEDGRPKQLRGTDDGSVFIGNGGVPLGKNGLTDRVRELGLRIRLKTTPHMLRHSCATHLLKGRADIRHIQKLLGHTSLQSTERYTKVEMTDLRSVIRRCHPREKDKP